MWSGVTCQGATPAASRSMGSSLCSSRLSMKTGWPRTTSSPKLVMYLGSSLHASLQTALALHSFLSSLSKTLIIFFTNFSFFPFILTLHNVTHSPSGIGILSTYLTHTTLCKPRQSLCKVVTRRQWAYQAPWCLSTDSNEGLDFAGGVLLAASIHLTQKPA